MKIINFYVLKTLIYNGVNTAEHYLRHSTHGFLLNKDSFIHSFLLLSYTYKEERKGGT